jgi:hypothetical protein
MPKLMRRSGGRFLANLRAGCVKPITDANNVVNSKSWGAGSEGTTLA